MGREKERIEGEGGADDNRCGSISLIRDSTHPLKKNPYKLGMAPFVPAKLANATGRIRESTGVIGTSGASESGDRKCGP